MELSLSDEQRIKVKFLAKLGKNGREIHEALVSVYGEDAMKESTVHKWLKRFREGREEFKDDPRPGRPSTSSSVENVDRVRNCLNRDRRSTVRMVSDELNLSKTVEMGVGFSTTTMRLPTRPWLCASFWHGPQLPSPTTRHIHPI
ncbi:PREDICTED: putative uncharacterized protein FLJ37770 [Vollenhovia emeryi]|uniref:putative uncharacterized protein FLJ37770 n=1 Tax=Vollenhovia emeryi TaxID=411798 RepID=UPI0005F4F1F9|nr:PREDICTED: putative uncharacterized protein FLJ37770 [Vollenhovia emeryi]